MCLYYKQVGEFWTAVGVYVDDLLVTETKQSAIGNLFVRVKTIYI